jgi:hypothetical protein
VAGSCGYSDEPSGSGATELEQNDLNTVMKTSSFITITVGICVQICKQRC